MTDMARQDPRNNLPWYRHVWVWLLMIPPAAAVVGGAATAWLAGGPPSLVVDDYGEIAMTTERRFTRDTRALELGLSASLLRPDPEGAGSEVWQLKLDSDLAYPQPQNLVLNFVHPTHEERDRRLPLVRAGTVYRGEMPTVGSRMYLQLTDPDGEWRLVGELSPSASALTLLPSSAAGRRP